MSKIAIIGTAGRDKTKPMTLALWGWMLADAKARIPKGSHLVSGGAAWADHLAVTLFMNGHAGELTLHLPAPFDIEQHRFIGPANSAASAANWYHQKFGQTIGWHTLRDISEVAEMPHVHGSFEPAATGYGGMFARNLKVAQAEELLAYTFGPGAMPADGGTKDTWDKCRGHKTHISLPYL